MWYLRRTRAVRAKMFTWEVVTDFDCDAPQESLQEAFAKEWKNCCAQIRINTIF